MGHTMNVPAFDFFGNPSAYAPLLRTLLEKFQDLPTAEFLNDKEVLKTIETLQAKFQEPPANRAGCPS